MAVKVVSVAVKVVSVAGEVVSVAGKVVSVAEEGGGIRLPRPGIPTPLLQTHPLIP